MHSKVIMRHHSDIMKPANSHSTIMRVIMKPIMRIMGPIMKSIMSPIMRIMGPIMKTIMSPTIRIMGPIMKTIMSPIMRIMGPIMKTNACVSKTQSQSNLLLIDSPLGAVFHQSNDIFWTDEERDIEFKWGTYNG